MKKIVVKLSLEDEKSKKRALKAVAGFEGVESVAVDMKEKKITLIGEADPVNVTAKLRRTVGYAEMLSVGPAKEEKKEAPPKQEPKKEEKKPDPVPKPEPPPTRVYLYTPLYEDAIFSDENPNACTIS